MCEFQFACSFCLFLIFFKLQISNVFLTRLLFPIYIELRIVAVEQTQNSNKSKFRTNPNFEQIQKFLTLGGLKIIQPPPLPPPALDSWHGIGNVEIFL